MTYDCGSHTFWVGPCANLPQALRLRKDKHSHVPHRAAQGGGPKAFCTSQNLAACSRGSPLHSGGSFTPPALHVPWPGAQHRATYRQLHGPATTHGAQQRRRTFGVPSCSLVNPQSVAWTIKFCNNLNGLCLHQTHSIKGLKPLNNRCWKDLEMLVVIWSGQEAGNLTKQSFSQKVPDLV